MKRVTILRTLHPDGAFGMMCGDDGLPFAVTLERTFENLRTVIPEGVHKATRSRYHKGGYDTFEIHIPGHSRVLFHRGNKEDHSLGCVLVAESFEQIDGKAGIANSAQGFKQFWDKYAMEQEIEVAVYTVEVIGRKNP